MIVYLTKKKEKEKEKSNDNKLKLETMMEQMPFFLFSLLLKLEPRLTRNHGLVRNQVCSKLVSNNKRGKLVVRVSNETHFDTNKHIG